MTTFTVDQVARTIQLVLAPAIMISACAILVSGMLTRSGSINGRLRAMARERLDLLREPSDTLTTARLEEIFVQLPDLLERLKLVHRAIGAVYTALLLFVLDSLLIALAVFSNSEIVAYMAMGCFLLGFVMLTHAVFTTVRELRMSLTSITYEVLHVSRLKPLNNLEEK